MKYTQFSEFSDLLEKNDLSLDIWKTNPEIKLIKEEGEEITKDDALKTKKGSILTKRGRARMALNKQAKKLQDGINKDITATMVQPLIDQKVKLYQKMAEVGKGKQPKEIVAELKADLQNMKKTQGKQVTNIENAANKVIQNSTKKIEAALEKNGFKEASLADLQSYWTLLTTQIMDNFLKKIAKIDDEAVGKTIQDKGILNAARLINKELNKDFNSKIAEKDNQIAKLKKEIGEKIKAEQESVKKEAKPEEVKPEEAKQEETKKGE